MTQQRGKRAFLFTAAEMNRAADVAVHDDALSRLVDESEMVDGGYVFALTDDEVARLRALSAMPPERPWGTT